jgi:hypothetical protein
VGVLPPEQKDCCSEIKVAMDRTSNINDELKEHAKVNRKEFDDVWTAINSLRNRLPNWAVLVISLLMALVGWLAAKVPIHAVT